MRARIAEHRETGPERQPPEDAVGKTSGGSVAVGERNGLGGGGSVVAVIECGWIVRRGAKPGRRTRPSPAGLRPSEAYPIFLTCASAFFVNPGGSGAKSTVGASFWPPVST